MPIPRHLWLICVASSAIWIAFANGALAAGAQSEQMRIERLHVVIPGGAGGGWDMTARGTGEALEKSGIAGRVTYENLSGGGGSKAIAHLLEVADPEMLMVNSTPIVVRALQRIFPQSFRDLVPVASVIGDYSVIAVRDSSPVTDTAALAAWQRAEPRRVAIAGGSVSGGTDHIVSAMIFQAFGADPRSVKYIPYDAGGKAMAGLLSGEVQALSSGYGEVVDLVRQGWVRILCIAALERLSSLPHVPTCHEQGAKGAEFVNWRGYFAAPGISDDRLSLYQQALESMMATPAWKTVRDRHGWVDLYKPGPEFLAMLEQQERTLGTLLKELELL